MEPKAIKFSESLTHRDYLGALLNLGIERSVIGDIVVQEKAAWFFCQNKMTDFFLDNLCRVRHTNILITKVDDPDKLPRP
ncbi:YlmH/Sll1252 family protein, partial [Acinetobacter baumannii]|uniref:YlmH/Sll1252 family protein n=1 Tax=Acinetobacter baumannii TaxID=470 RepID=UPI003318AEF4